MSTFYNSKNTSLATGPGRGCLSPNSYIITDDGTKPIEKVQEGDFVLNRDGKFRKVIKKFKYEVKEDLLNIKIFFDEDLI